MMALAQPFWELPSQIGRGFWSAAPSVLAIGLSIIPTLRSGLFSAGPSGLKIKTLIWAALG